MESKAIIPAMDISEGRCIRLTQGDFNDKQVYDADPVETARQFAQWGAKRLHIVDLDAAFGRGNNRGIIREIRQTFGATECIIEVGGGIRSESDVKALLSMGVDRLALGTVLINDFFEVQRWTHSFGDVFVASVDDRGGMVQVAGWLTDSAVSVGQFLQQISKITLRSVAYTNIYDDGMLHGIDVDKGNAVASQAHVPVVLSGGIGSIEDIDAFMNNAAQNVCGVIVGKAIYEGKIDIQKVLEKYPSPSCDSW